MIRLNLRIRNSLNVHFLGGWICFTAITAKSVGIVELDMHVLSELFPPFVDFSIYS